MTARILFVLWIVIGAEATAQVQVSAGAGFGWFSMKSLQEFQEDIRSSLPVDARITEAFPGYAVYYASMLYQFRSAQFIGLSYEFGSTGGRVYYSDFSGEIYGDQLVRYNALILNFGDTKTWSHGWSLRVDIHPGLTFTKLELVESTTIGEQTSRGSNKFHSINVNAQPTVELIKTWNRIGAKVFVGYSAAVYQGKLKVVGGDAYLVGLDNKAVVADWNGLRLGVSAIYSIGKSPSVHTNN